MERNLVQEEGSSDAKLQSDIKTEEQRCRDLLGQFLHCIKFLTIKIVHCEGIENHSINRIKLEILSDC